MFDFSVNPTMIQQPTVFIDFKSLPYICASGIYDATVYDLILSELNVNGTPKPILRLNLICEVNGKQGQLSLNLETDINDKRFKDTQDFAIVTGMVDPQGKMLFREEVVQLKTALSNGQTTMTTFPDFSGKKLKVAVRRSSRNNSKGVPYMNASAYLNLAGQTVFEIFNKQAARWITENTEKFIAECAPLMNIQQQQQPQQQEYNYGVLGTQENNSQQGAQTQSMYGSMQPQQPSAQAQSIYGGMQPQTKADEIPF